MPEEKDFQEDLRIDRYALDEVCTDHANLVAEWGLKWADAVRERDRLEGNLALVRGQCDQDIREFPDKFGWQKPDKAPTEGFINSAIATHEEYITANSEYQEAKHEVDILVVAKNAFEHRDHRIRDLSSLYASGYYSANKKLDVGYQEIIHKVAVEEQTTSLEKNNRLARRKVGE
jgi:hypothetical protein